MKRSGRSVTFTNILKRAYRHADFLAKVARVSFIRKWIDNIAKNDELVQLTRDNAILVNQEVEKPDDMILPSKIVEHFINETDYRWIMNFCMCRDSLTCNDYPIDLGCLFIGKAALGINPKLGRRVTREEALEHLKKCRKAGLVHMIGRNNFDAKWLGVKPEQKLLTICNCCPCCCITRNAKNVWFINNSLKKLPGVTVKVGEKCVGCGTCTNGSCFIEAIQVIGNHAMISEECRGCGRCVEVCPQNAIELTINDENFIKKTIKRMESLVDVT